MGITNVKGFYKNKIDSSCKKYKFCCHIIENNFFLFILIYNL